MATLFERARDLVGKVFDCVIPGTLTYRKKQADDSFLEMTVERFDAGVESHGYKWFDPVNLPVIYQTLSIEPSQIPGIRVERGDRLRLPSGVEQVISQGYLDEVAWQIETWRKVS